jgi:site-specific DNA recombinase
MRRPPPGRCAPTRGRFWSTPLATLIRWLDELVSEPLQTLESLALRERKTERSIRMTLSLAFLAPDIVKPAVEGRLPRGFGLKRLVDLPMAWSDQWRALGLAAPARA